MKNNIRYKALYQLILLIYIFLGISLSGWMIILTYGANILLPAIIYYCINTLLVQRNNDLKQIKKYIIYYHLSLILYFLFQLGIDDRYGYIFLTALTGLIESSFNKLVVENIKLVSIIPWANFIIASIIIGRKICRKKPLQMN
jgi:hypothetical protein